MYALSVFVRASQLVDLKQNVGERQLTSEMEISLVRTTHALLLASLQTNSNFVISVISSSSLFDDLFKLSAVTSNVN
jgi:hypothetical protein